MSETHSVPGRPISRRTLGVATAAGLGAALGAGTPAAAEESVAAETWEVVVNGFDDAAVQAAVTALFSNQSTFGSAVRRKLVFPPGVYNLTQPLLREGVVTGAGLEMLYGLTIEGMAPRSTHINWNNGTVPFITANQPRHRFLTIRGLSVNSQHVDNEFAYCVSEATGGYNQGWKFADLEFQGTWKRVITLGNVTTANLNSEFVLERIFTSPSCEFTDAFFRSGGLPGQPTGQQIQFLNYWIKDCCLSLRKGTVFRFDRGGSVRVQNGSWSAQTGATGDANGPVTWFHMPNASSNNPSVNQLSVRDVRFEPKRGDHVIINCHWAGGSVLFDSCSDGGGAQNTASYDFNLHRYTGTNLWGSGGVLPSVRYTQCQLLGYHTYTGDAGSRGGFSYDNSFFFRGLNGDKAPATQSGGAGSALRWSGGAPKYRFVDNWNIDNATNQPPA